jgi:dihydrofolate reductase
MIVSAIAAMDRKGLIGRGSGMPWHLPRDLRRFRKYTLGRPVILGRATLESLRGPLPDRPNIVLTQDPSTRGEGFRSAGSVDGAFKIADEYLESSGGNEVFIIGGGIVFEATCHLWDRLLLTVVDGDFEGDTYFPLPQVRSYQWRTAHEEYFDRDSRNEYAHWFLFLERVRGAGAGRQGQELSRLLKGLVPARGPSPPEQMPL